ncbi:MAG: putative prolyl oligopeptidase family protein [Bradyrhizobium sp.]|nr:putative prolyl oligopeptidase family protein [Bradyrhizobium sp.]
MLRRNFLALASAVILASAAHADNARHPLASVPFTVRDSIQMTRVMALDGSATPNEEGVTALYSPDRRHFVIRTRAGDLKKNVIVETILLFDTADVSRRLSKKDEPDPIMPRVLGRLEVTRDVGEMSHLQWLSNGELGFIGEGANRVTQAFAVDAAGGGITQLTRSDTPVRSFAVSGDTILYLANVQDSTAQVVPVRDHGILPLLWKSYPQVAPVELVEGSRRSPTVRKFPLPPSILGPGADRIWLSPSARFAVILAPSVNAPPSWSEYVAYNKFWSFSADKISDDPTSPMLGLHPRYLLIDLRMHSVRPLLDAPSGAIAWNGTPKAVFWPKDEKSVVVSNTYLPLSTADPAERSRRRAGPAIADVSLEDGAAHAIAWEPMRTEMQLRAGVKAAKITSVAWDADTSELTIGKTGATGQIRSEAWRKLASGWGSAEVRLSAVPTVPNVVRREALNERPKVFADGGECACRRLLFDPAPDADNFRFGRVEPFVWTDSNKIEWRSGLVYPPDYQPGRRYPLIVQTHGFDPNEFLLDGPSGGTAFAAQALANVGFVVLQVADPQKAATQDEQEGKLFADGFEAGIRELVARGIADPKHVGLIAFSHTGFDAIQLMADHPDLLEAANISDSALPSYVQDVMAASAINEPERVASFEALNAGSSSGAGYGQWFASSPLYQLSKIRTAVRLEAPGLDSAVAMMEAYVVLARAGRPVDMIYFPEGDHNLQKPFERLGSQGGNVDWFRFWLQGVEDPDPEKAAQYAFWRRLRSARDGVSAGKTRP